MHDVLADLHVKRVRQRITEGDCKVTGALSAEMLEFTIENLASRLEQALSTGPAHDAGVIEAMARVGAYVEAPAYFSLTGRLLRAYDPTGRLPFEDAQTAFLAHLRLILQALAGHDRHRFGSPPEPVVNPNEAWCDAYAAWYYQEPA